MVRVVRVSHRENEGSIEVRLPAELIDRLKLAPGGSLVALAINDGILITTEAHADEAEQLALGREIMRQFDETMRRLARS